jgi:carboxypeptidase Taq
MQATHDVTATAKLDELKARLQDIFDLGGVGSLLGWDQSTYMPPGGSAARGRQLALVGKLAHEKSTDAALGKLLDDLRQYAESLPFDSDEAALIRVARRDFERATKVPNAFMGELYEHTALTYDAWTTARPANDFKRVQPLLEKTLDLSRKLAEFFAPFDHIGDPLIDMADFGMKTADIRALFADLRAQLAPIAKAITEQAPADDSFLYQDYPEAGIEAFSVDVIKAFGYDYTRGRLDKTHHPFMTKFSLGDVRITTRYPKHNLPNPLFSTLHEAGHAMYEQGIEAAYEGTPLGGGTSAGIHESQSRLWENVVGRSRPFWEFYYPKLQAVFPEQLKNVSLDQFYRAVNKVERSLIRTEADEVTYNLHVMIRFDLETDMLEGKLAIRDLPEAWHSRYQSDLGLRAPDDRDGALQDVHWHAGIIGGAFQGYTLGNIMGAQFYALALKAHPEIPTEVGRGEFKALRAWMTENIYQDGSKCTAPELIQRVVGGPISIAPYIEYLRGKYGALYTL